MRRLVVFLGGVVTSVCSMRHLPRRREAGSLLCRGGSGWNNYETNWGTGGGSGPQQSDDDDDEEDDMEDPNDDDDDMSDEDPEDDAEAARSARRWTKRAFKEAQRGRLEAAAQAFEKAVRATPEDAPYRAALLINAGSFYAFSGKPQEALVPLREAHRLAPDDARALHALGNALHQCDASNEALEVYTEALTKSPTPDFPPNAPLLNNVATILLTMGERELARHSLERSLKIEPNAPGTLFNLAMALYTDAHDNAVRRAYGDLGEDDDDEDDDEDDDYEDDEDEEEEAKAEDRATKVKGTSSSSEAGAPSKPEKKKRNSRRNKYYKPSRLRYDEEVLKVDLDEAETQRRREKMNLLSPVFEPEDANQQQQQTSSSRSSAQRSEKRRDDDLTEAQKAVGYKRPRPMGAVAARRTVVHNATQMELNIETRVTSMSRKRVKADPNAQQDMKQVIALLDRAEPHAPSGSSLRERILALRGVAAARIPGREKDAVKDLEDCLRHGAEHASDRNRRATALLELADVVDTQDRKLSVLRQAINILEDKRPTPPLTTTTSSSSGKTSTSSKGKKASTPEPFFPAAPSNDNNNKQQRPFLSLGGKYRGRPGSGAEDEDDKKKSDKPDVLGKTDSGSIVFRKRNRHDAIVALRANAKSELGAVHADRDDLDQAFAAYFAAAQDGLRGSGYLYESPAGEKLRNHDQKKFDDLMDRVAHNDALACINALANALTPAETSQQPQAPQSSQ